MSEKPGESSANGKPRKAVKATKPPVRGRGRRPVEKSAGKTVPEPRYFNRDESWLRFNGRVLEEASTTANPLLERVKFLAITASNLDEFVEIRVAGILQRIDS